MTHNIIWTRDSLGLTIIFLGLALSSPLWAADYFVSPQGADGNPGTIEAPFASLAQATRVVQPGDTCYLREGIYREVLRPTRSGEPGAEIRFMNWRNEKAVITGLDPLQGWTHAGDGVYATDMPWSLEGDNQIFANGPMMSEACWPAPGENPLFKPVRAVASGGSETTLIERPARDEADEVVPICAPCHGQCVASRKT